MRGTCHTLGNAIDFVFFNYNSIDRTWDSICVASVGMNYYFVNCIQNCLDVQANKNELKFISQYQLSWAKFSDVNLFYRFLDQFFGTVSNENINMYPSSNW